MTLAIAGLVSGQLTAVLAVWLTYRLTVRQAGGEAAMAARAVAATDLYAPLRELQSLIRRHGRLAVDPADVALAFRSFSDSDDRHHHRLPPPLAHLRESICAAAGTALGGISFVDLDPAMGYVGLAEPDGQWRDYADD